MNLINPLVTASVPNKTETARVALDSLKLCPICNKPMRLARTEVSQGVLQTRVCLQHRIQLPELAPEEAHVQPETRKRVSNLNVID